MNIFCGIGRLGSAPSVKHTKVGTSVVSGQLAVRRGQKSKATNQYETDWIRFVVWGKNAENFAEVLHKGSKVSINGELHQRKYTNKAGNKVEIFEVIVDRWTNEDPIPANAGKNSADVNGIMDEIQKLDSTQKNKIMSMISPNSFADSSGHSNSPTHNENNNVLDGAKDYDGDNLPW